jgi:hypothetical protein
MYDTYVSMYVCIHVRMYIRIYVCTNMIPTPYNTAGAHRESLELFF